MRTVGPMVALLGAALVTMPALTACASPDYHFVANDDHDAVLRVPSTWDHISAGEAMRATGEKATETQGWLAFYDGSAKPSALHATAPYTEAPMLMARSVDISAENQDAVTDDVLRDIIYPVTEAGRAQEQASAAAAGQTLPEFKLLKDTTRSSDTEQGVHVLFSYTSGGHTEVYDQVAVTDPKRTRIHLALVHCSQTCFASRGAEMDQVVSSLTVKKT